MKQKQVNISKTFYKTRIRNEVIHSCTDIPANCNTYNKGILLFDSK